MCIFTDPPPLMDVISSPCIISSPSSYELLSLQYCLVNHFLCAWFAIRWAGVQNVQKQRHEAAKAETNAIAALKSSGGEYSLVIAFLCIGNSHQNTQSKSDSLIYMDTQSRILQAHRFTFKHNEQVTLNIDIHSFVPVWYIHSRSLIKETQSDFWNCASTCMSGCTSISGYDCLRCLFQSNITGYITIEVLLYCKSSVLPSCPIRPKILRSNWQKIWLFR